MNVELYIDGQLADLDKKDFAYTLQVNNLFDFDTREFSYSDVLYLPTTPNNSQIFGFSDTPASDNRGAYKRYMVDFYVNGIAITLRANGFLMGKRGDRFIFDFKENSKDVFQLMVGKKLKDLPLEEFKHEKTLHKIQELNTPEDANLIYALADYGAETIKKNNGVDYYNFDYCPPSIKMDWILQQIKKLNPQLPYVFESSFFESQFWKSLYMTISDIKKTTAKELFKELLNSAMEINFTGVGGWLNNSLNINTIDLGFKDSERGTKIIQEIGKDATGKYVIPEDGKYKISISTSRIKLFVSTLNPIKDFKLFFGLKCGNKVVWEEIFQNKTQEKSSGVYIGEFFRTETFNAKKGEEVCFFVRKRDDIANEHERNVMLYARGGVVINQVADVDIQSQISDLSLIDWFKEVMRLFSLTPMKDDKTNNVQQFYTLSQRVNEAPELDWSDKFIRITEEKYHDTSAYGQVNKFKYNKYDEQDNQQDDNDFDLIFNDPAIVFEKEFKSKFFLGIPNASETEIKNKNLDKVLFFEKEIIEKEKNGQKEIEIKYKDLNNRPHIFRSVDSDNVDGFFTSGTYEFSKVKALTADSEPLQWKNLLHTYYADLPRLMENLHAITCEFALTEIDIHNFSFFSRIYVEQFGHYFLPNKIIYRPEKPAVVEMIKIRHNN